MSTLSGHPTVPTSMTDDTLHRRKLAEVVNRLITGHFNVNVDLTLDQSTDSTTLTDSRISTESAILATPLNADAATDLTSIYYSDFTRGSVTVNHPNRTNSREYRFTIIG